MNIGVGYGRRTGAATLAIFGLLVVADPMRVGNPMIPGAAYADTIRSVASVCDWTKVQWDELSGAEKQAFQSLGWSKNLWESASAPASFSKNWSDLSSDEKNAAQSLGFSEQNWQTSCPS